MSNSARPHRRQPTRLLCPWDSPGKNTGVGCHFLLQCMKVKIESEVTQSCPTQWPHGLKPTRLLHLWDFPSKSNGVGCHCLLWCPCYLFPFAWVQTWFSSQVFYFFFSMRKHLIFQLLNVCLFSSGTLSSNEIFPRGQTLWNLSSELLWFIGEPRTPKIVSFGSLLVYTILASRSLTILKATFSQCNNYVSVKHDQETFPGKGQIEQVLGIWESFGQQGGPTSPS